MFKKLTLACLGSLPLKATVNVMETGASLAFQEKIFLPQIPPLCPLKFLLCILAHHVLSSPV